MIMKTAIILTTDLWCHKHPQDYFRDLWAKEPCSDLQVVHFLGRSYFSHKKQVFVTFQRFMYHFEQFGLKFTCMKRLVPRHWRWLSHRGLACQGLSSLAPGLCAIWGSSLALFEGSKGELWMYDHSNPPPGLSIWFSIMSFSFLWHCPRELPMANIIESSMNPGKSSSSNTMVLMSGEL